MPAAPLLRALAAAVIAAGLCAGCSSQIPGTPGATGSTPAEAGSTAEPDTGSGASAAAVDACSLIPAAEVDALIGANGGGELLTSGNPDDDGSVCEWENPDTYHSVTVDIGNSGTSASGELPEWEPALGPERPLPDTMRSLGGGQIEFVAADRLCHLQVVTDRPGDADEQTAVELARAVRGRL